MTNVSQEQFNHWRRRVLAGWAILLVGVGIGFARIESTASTGNETAKTLASLVEKNQKSSVNQLANRVANVGTWCGAINESRDEARRRAKIGPAGTPPYKLGDLNCKQLEEETAHSSVKTTQGTQQAHIDLRAAPW